MSRRVLLAVLAVAALTAAQEQPLIEALEIRGNEIHADAFFFERITSRVGSRLSPTSVAADIERLFALGAFDDIVFSVEPYGDGVKLIITVIERPTVGSVSYIGADELKRADVAELISSNLVAGEPLDPAAVNEIVMGIRRMGREAGLLRCEVTPEYTTDERGRVNVRFVIEEGSEVRISAIDFIGNTAYTSWEIRNLFMSLSEDEFWRKSLLDMDTLEEDLVNIVRGYNNGGYINARVEDYELIFNEKGDRVSILITIHEGDRYSFSGVELSGNTILTETQIRRRLRLAPGDTFNQARYDASLAAVKDDYWEFGYVFLDIRETVKVDEENRTIGYDWRFIENEPARVGELTIVGNTDTKDKVIRREFTIYPGEIFDGKAFRRSLERVFNLQYFENVIPDWEVDYENRVIDLTVRVIERAGTTKISAGAGYSSRDGLMGTFSVSWINFDFAALPAFWKAKGGGQSLTLEADIGGQVNNYRVSFVEPWFLDTPTTIGAGVYLEKTHSIFRYERTRFGFFGLVGRPLGDDARWRLRYDYAETTLEPKEDASQSVIDAAGTSLISSLTLTLSRNTRDNFFFPTTGSTQLLSLRLGGGFLGGDVDFYKISATLTNYFPSFWRFVLAFRVNASYAAPYGQSDEVPIYERFFVGGNDVRGHQDFHLSPRDREGKIIGGNFEFYYNLEYRIPIAERLLFAMLFFDMGYAWPDIGSVDFNDMRYGYGVGVRIDIPMVGLMGFDYGWSPELPEGRLHFSIANTF